MTEPAAAPPDYSIAAVERALDLIEALARIGPATLADLAKEAKCTRTAGFRLLRTLQARGFAIQDSARGRWRLGALWGTLARQSAEQDSLAAAARPTMDSLARIAAEIVFLLVRDGLEAEMIAECRPAESLRRFVAVGQRLPLHAGPGRLLLAHAPEVIQSQVLARRLPRFTEATPTDPKKIIGDFSRVRARGYLITGDEIFTGAVFVAAPIRSANGDVIAALVLAASSLRMRPPRPQSLLKPVMDAATGLSQFFGYRLGQPIAGQAPSRNAPPAAR